MGRTTDGCLSDALLLGEKSYLEGKTVPWDFGSERKERNKRPNSNSCKTRCQTIRKQTDSSPPHSPQSTIYETASYHREKWASQVVQNLPANAGDAIDSDSIPRSGRSPGVGNGNPLQYSCLENPVDKGHWWATVHGVAKSWT